MSQVDNEDDSFIIILGSSPGSLEGKSNGDLKLPVTPIMDNVIKDLPDQANKAFKAQFNLGDSPSPASMMVASTLITVDRSSEELQKRFGELLDENVVLKETLKQNNDSLKEQFSLIASCQDDMLRTHKLHKEKFDETRSLVEKLRLENKRLKEEIMLITKNKDASLTNGIKSGPSSGLEFVTSPEDDTINKLTAQLELVEKQRRQVIVDNEKLTWQRESLEHIINATTKERDDLKEKLNSTELLLMSKENNHTEELKQLHGTIDELRKKMNFMAMNIHSTEIQKKDSTIQGLEGKVTSLQNDLKKAQITILDLENIKLDFAKYKGGVTDMTKTHKEQIQELNTKIKSIQAVVFQPVLMTMDCEGEGSPHYGQYLANVKLYDRTLKHIAEYLNQLSNGLSDDLVKIMSVISSIQDVVLERASIEKVRTGLGDLKQAILQRHTYVLGNIAQVKSTFTIFEGIFKDYNEMVKRTLTKREETPAVEKLTASQKKETPNEFVMHANRDEAHVERSEETEEKSKKTVSSFQKKHTEVSNQTPAVEQLTAALLARGKEIQTLENEIALLVGHNEDIELLKAQVELYKSDFEEERKSREKMVTEKEKIATDLRILQKNYIEITSQMGEVRKLSPTVYKTAVARISKGSLSAAATTAASSAHAVQPPTRSVEYSCPKCSFNTTQYKVLEDHFDFCLDDF